MLAMSPSCSYLGWDYPTIQIPTTLQHQQQEINSENWNLDSLILPKFSPSQAQHNRNDLLLQKRSDESSPRSTSSTNDYCNINGVTKKLNHNASERERRKKINYLFSTLRSLVPPNHHSKKMSIPATVGHVLKYIPELQKEVDKLINKKDEMLSKISNLQGIKSDFNREQKPKVKENSMQIKQSCSISLSKLGMTEMIIQISSIENISMPDILHKLELDGFLVLDVSSFRSFGGNTFYTIHLSVEGANTMTCETLSDKLPRFIHQQIMNNQTLLM